MAEFLSDEWLDELEEAAVRATVPSTIRLTVQQVVDDGGVERAYALRIEGGRVHVLRGRVADADVTFTQDRATAAAIAQGHESAQAAFLAGRLRIGGDLHRYGDAAVALAEVGDVFAQLRATTTF
ncbi:MAG TPA: SCP2 sterol-binding domain-containing protein [Acidimicrobiales bacterium]|nr:SCP2 sterol-binding domain-containing protein [Acidimicrobiales bacterium]